MFEIKESPAGKGLSMFATRQIKRGELIIAEKPLFTYQQGVDANTLNKIMSKLSASDSEKFFQLADCHTPNAKTAIGITLTNSLPLGNGSSSRGIFPIISRICHSCLPNAAHSWDKVKLVEKIYCLKTMEVGDEILITYCEQYATKAERQLHLSGFKFECQCEVCAEKDEAKLKASDTRRTQIAQLYNQIPNMYPYNPQRALDMNKQMLEIFREENIFYDANLLHAVAYDQFQMLAQLPRGGEKAKRDLVFWAKMAVKNRMVSHGVWGDEAFGLFSDMCLHYSKC